jgi:hypothetical protein
MKIKSVGVKWGKYTRQEVQDFLDWCVEQGAEPFNGLRNTSSKFEYEYAYKFDFNHFGVNEDGLTYTDDVQSFYNTIVSTIEGAKDLIDPNWRGTQEGYICYLTGVAIIHNSTGLMLTLPEEKRHMGLYHAIHKMGLGDVDIGDFTLGFVDSGGKFHDRVEAVDVAIKSGQIKGQDGLTELDSYNIW